MIRYKIFQGDCLEVMQEIREQSIDAIITDLPYGTTYCKWDSVIDFEKMWEQSKRILKDNSPFVTTADQPFTSVLIASNLNWFRHSWVWNKVQATNFANANHQPMKIHEDVVVFSKKKATFNPQKVAGAVNHSQGKNPKINLSETRKIDGRVSDDFSGMKFPQSIQVFPKHSSQVEFHPTQKPVDLYEYLIKTYTNKDDFVLDICMGSGTTGVAALNLGRRFIGIELDESYFEIASRRIKEVAG